MNPMPGGNWNDVEQRVTMYSLSSSQNSWPEHSEASRGLTDVIWNSVHIIEAVVHFMVVVVKVVTSPIWWPVSKLKNLGNRPGKQAQDPYATDLNRPLFK